MKERVTMELWKNHYAYILRRFVVISMLTADQNMIEPITADRMSWPSWLILVPLCASVPRPDHVIRLTFPIRKGTVT
jgi:hypothetical protein